MLLIHHNNASNIPNDLLNIDPTPPLKNVIIQNLMFGVFKYIYLKLYF